MYPFKILNKKKYALCFINALLENICIYAVPVVLSICLATPFTLDKFKILIIAIIILKSLEVFFDVLWCLYAEPFLEQNNKDLHISYFKRICNMNMAKIHDSHTGYLKRQIDTVCDETTRLLEEVMSSVNGFMIAISIFLVQVFRQSLFMFCLCLIFIFLIILYNLLITKANIKVQEDYNDKHSKYNATLVDFLQNIKIVKNFDALDYADHKINQKFEKVKKPIKKINIFRSLRGDGINALIHIMYVIVLISLFVQMKNGADVFSYLVFYSSIFSGLSTELRGVGYLFMHWNKFKSANNQVEGMIVEEEKQNKIRNFHDIMMKDICFKYYDESNITIEIPNFSLTKNDKVSIVGESGQGKSTFLSLFCRFYEVDDDKFLVDHHPSLKAPDIAYISQETDLFDLTIKENLTLGKKISNKKLEEYLEDSGLLDWVHTLEKGLDTLVGEKGVKLSAGQKQRLNLIRGILLEKEIYILDEPTSNLDSVSEEKINHMILKYLKQKTCIIVTHRPKLTEICNKHYYFENRKMIQKENPSN